jgi:hypothetical protein
MGLLLMIGLPLLAHAQFGTGQRKPSTTETASTAAACETKYDRFKQKTTITSAPRIIYRSSAPQEELSVSAGIVKDDEVKNDKVKEIELLFLSVAERWRYHNEADVNFIVDGKRVPAGTAYAMGGVPVMNQVREKMQLTLATEKFLQIINGREVEMKMGPTEIVLKPADLEALRGFAKCAGVSTE